MKKTLLTICASALLLCSCSNSVTYHKATSTTTLTPLTTPVETITSESGDYVSPAGVGQDYIDLTDKSDTFIYAEIYNITLMPDNYLGKTIKFTGEFMTAYDEEKQQTHYCCIVMDATACCMQGLEFQVEDPSILPEEGSTITVEGVLDSYIEGNAQYLILKDSVLF